VMVVVALEVAVEVDTVVETAVVAVEVETAVVAVEAAVAATTATKRATLLVNAPSNVPKVEEVATTTAIRQNLMQTRDSQMTNLKTRTNSLEKNMFCLF